VLTCPAIRLIFFTTTNHALYSRAHHFVLYLLRTNVMTTALTMNSRAAATFYPDSLFEGPFSPHSPEFTTACAHAALAGEAFCEAYLIVYTTKCLSTMTYAVFELNRPVTILTGLGDLPHRALYGMVRAINVWSDDPREVRYVVTVEVHAPPKFVFNWSTTVPWPGALSSAEFIHPHAFLTPGYFPLSLADPSTITTATVRYDLLLSNCMVTSDPFENHSLNQVNSRLPSMAIHPPSYPPNALIAELNPEYGEFISMVVRPSVPFTSQTPVVPYPRTSASSVEGFDDGVLGDHIHFAVGNDDLLSLLPWRMSPLCPSQTTWSLLTE